MASLLKSIYHKLFSAPQQESAATNVIKGDNVFIDQSALLVTVGKGQIILEGNNYIGKDVELGTTGTIKIGDNTSLQNRCIILEDVEIGIGCIFAPNVYISSGRHYFDHKPNLHMKDQDALVASDPKLSKEHSKKVIIGDDCWLGINAVIMSGVTIGRGCVIGANSVVTSDVEPFSVVGGIPAKVLKKRLEFSAKKSISFNNENDLPNFYKGFLIDSKNLADNSKRGGLIAKKEFTCYLSTEGKTISLEIGDLWPQDFKLNYNGQEKTVSTRGFTTVEFTLGKDQYHHFTIEGVSTVRIKSITIK